MRSYFFDDGIINHCQLLLVLRGNREWGRCSRLLNSQITRPPGPVFLGTFAPHSGHGHRHYSPSVEAAYLYCVKFFVCWGMGTARRTAQARLATRISARTDAPLQYFAISLLNKELSPLVQQALYADFIPEKRRKKCSRSVCVRRNARYKRVQGCRGTVFIG